jgi:hypothetical protein
MSDNLYKASSSKTTEKAINVEQKQNGLVQESEEVIEQMLRSLDKSLLLGKQIIDKKRNNKIEPTQQQKEEAEVMRRYQDPLFWSSRAMTYEELYKERDAKLKEIRQKRPDSLPKCELTDSK